MKRATLTSALTVAGALAAGATAALVNTRVLESADGAADGRQRGRARRRRRRRRRPPRGRGSTARRRRRRPRRRRRRRRVAADDRHRRPRRPRHRPRSTSPVLDSGEVAGAVDGCAADAPRAPVVDAPCGARRRRPGPRPCRPTDGPVARRRRTIGRRTGGAVHDRRPAPTPATSRTTWDRGDGHDDGSVVAGHRTGRRRVPSTTAPTAAADVHDAPAGHHHDTAAAGDPAAADEPADDVGAVAAVVDRRAGRLTPADGVSRWRRWRRRSPARAGRWRRGGARSSCRRP